MVMGLGGRGGLLSGIRVGRDVSNECGSSAGRDGGREE